MNCVFLYGRVMTEVDFRFIYNKKRISKAYCYVELKDKIKLKIIGYDNIADFMLKKIKIDTRVCIYGVLNSDMEIEIKTVEIGF